MLVRLSWPCQSCQSCFSYLRRFFFSYRALAEDSELLEQGIDNFGARILGSSSHGFFIDWPWVLALTAVMWADREPQRQCWSISLMVAQSCRLALASTTTAFFTIWTKLFNSWSSFCRSAKKDGLRPFWKYLSIVGLAGTSTRSYANKINYRYSRCIAYSSTDSCWC